MLDEGRGLVPDIPSIHEFFPLHYAAAAQSIECAALLLDRGANPSASVGDNGITPLFLAARFGSALIINMLFDMDAKFEPTAMRNGLSNPLNESLRCKHLDCFDVLIERGLVPSQARGSRNYTPLMYAITNELYEAVPILLDKGVDVNAVSSSNHYSALYLACLSGNYRLVRMLNSAATLRMDVRGPGQSTPIHWAATSCVPDIVRYVIECGADVHAVNANGETAIADALRPRRTTDKSAQSQERSVLDQIATLRILVENGLSVNGQRKDKSFFVQTYLTRPLSVDVRVLDYMFSAEPDPLNWRLVTPRNETLGDYMWNLRCERSEVKTFLQQKLLEKDYVPKTK